MWGSVLLQLGGDSPRAPSQPPAPGNWRLAGLRVEEMRPSHQVPGTLPPVQVPARRAPSRRQKSPRRRGEGSTKSRSRAVGAPGKRSSSRPSVPGKAPASQLRQGAHRTRREQSSRPAVGWASLREHLQHLAGRGCGCGSWHLSLQSLPLFL